MHGLSHSSAALQQQIAMLKASHNQNDDGMDARIQFLFHQVRMYIRTYIHTFCVYNSTNIVLVHYMQLSKVDIYTFCIAGNIGDGFILAIYGEFVSHCHYNGLVIPQWGLLALSSQCTTEWCQLTYYHLKILVI